MAQNYAISETTLTALADAVRKNVGETKLVPGDIKEPVVKISKTSNALSFTERSGGYGNAKTLYDVVSISGASKIVVDIAYQTESTNYDWVQIAVGSVSSAPSTSTYPKYGGTTLTRKELIFEDTDTITFYFKSDSSNDTYLGYYAECRGYDEEGNIVGTPIYEEVPNTMTVDTMISALNNLSSSGNRGKMVWENVAEESTNGQYNISTYLEKYNQLIVFITYNGSYVYAMIIENGVLSPCYNDNGKIFKEGTLTTPTFQINNGILKVSGSKASASYATVMWVE